MPTSDLNPHILLEMYGAELAQEFLLDLLDEVKSQEERTHIENAVDALMELVAEQQKDQIIFVRDEPQPSFTRLPPAFQREGVEIWLFEDAFISFNSLAGHFHGYRKVNGQTIRLPYDEVKLYREYIDNPSKLLSP